MWPVAARTGIEGAALQPPAIRESAARCGVVLRGFPCGGVYRHARRFFLLGQQQLRHWCIRIRHRQHQRKRHYRAANDGGNVHRYPAHRGQLRRAACHLHRHGQSRRSAAHARLRHHLPQRSAHCIAYHAGGHIGQLVRYRRDQQRLQPCRFAGRPHPTAVYPPAGAVRCNGYHYHLFPPGPDLRHRQSPGAVLRIRRPRAPRRRHHTAQCTSNLVGAGHHQRRHL